MKLCEHPKYVLATFPDAYRVPFLNAWIQNRYGVIPSQRERNELLHESKFFWEWLIPSVTAMRWPVCKDLGMQGRVNWNFKRRLERTVSVSMSKLCFRMVNTYNFYRPKPNSARSIESSNGSKCWRIGCTGPRWIPIGPMWIAFGRCSSIIFQIVNH